LIPIFTAQCHSIHELKKAKWSATILLKFRESGSKDGRKFNKESTPALCLEKGSHEVQLMSGLEFVEATIAFVFYSISF
jgi:hypothetical protein